MRVFPPPTTNLAPDRPPREHGRRSKDPIFELETDELPKKLLYRPDPEDSEHHGFIEPAPDALRRVSAGRPRNLHHVATRIIIRTLQRHLLISAEVTKRYGRIGSWIAHFQKKLPTGVKEDG